MIRFLIENQLYSTSFLKRIVGLKFMYSNLSTNHEIYKFEDMTLRFERLPDGLRYLGVLYKDKKQLDNRDGCD